MKYMRKIIAALLALLMTLALSGCAESLQQIEIPPFPVVTPSPEPAAPDTENAAQADETVAADGTELIVPEEQEAAEEEKGTVVLVWKRTVSSSDYDPAEHAELILSYSYDVLRVSSEELADACSRINETLATIEETFYTGNDYGLDLQFLGYNAMLEQAEDNFAYVKEYQVEGIPLEFSDSLSARVTRADGSMLSVVYANSSFTGGAHGSYGTFAYNFDMQTGEVLTLDKLSADPAALKDALVQIMLSQAEEDRDGYYSEKISDDFLPAGGREEAFRTLLREGSWYFDREGMVIVSSLYELGPYAVGITEFFIPYSSLESIVDSRWLFPSEHRGGKGKLEVTTLEELEGGETAIVDKLSINPEGEELCILVDGRIYDVSVSTVYYVDRFYEDVQLWYASCLADCALQLQVIVPEGLPNLQITYYTADGVRHGKLLSQNGADGSYLLVDDDIEAVG